MKVLDRPV